MTELLCHNQKISAPCENRRTNIFTSYIFQYGWHCRHNSGQPTVARRWQADGGPTVANRWWADVGKQRKCGTGYPSARRRWTAGGNLPLIATGGPTASCYLGSNCADIDSTCRCLKMSGSALCSPGPIIYMFPGSYVPWVRPMFPGSYVPRVLCWGGGANIVAILGVSPMFPGSYVPRVLCSPGPMFPGTYVPRVLCSPGPMFPGSYVGGRGPGVEHRVANIAIDVGI